MLAVVCSAATPSASVPPMPAAASASSAAERVVVPSFSISTATSGSQVSLPSSMLPVRTTANTVTFGTLP